jgi:hypothetical protein
MKKDILEFTKSPFEDLGSMKEFCEKFGQYTPHILNLEDENICLIIQSEQEIEIMLYCSKALSNIFRESKGFPEEFENYRVIRITDENGNKYIRLTQVIEIRMNPDVSIEECLKFSKNLKGSVRLSLRLEDIKETENNVEKEKNIESTEKEKLSK